MKCFYHSDADGKCAGFWVHQSVGIQDMGLCNDMPQMIPIDYRIPFPMDIIRPHEQIYIVDFSIEPSMMVDLLKITDDVTWIDHHKTSIEKYNSFPTAIRGVRFDGVSGCMLTYCYIHHMTQRGIGDIKPFNITMTKDAPMFTKLIDDWDVWKFDYGDDTRYFQTAFNAYNFAPDSIEWHKFWDEEQELIEQGKAMLKFRDGWARQYMDLGFETKFEGYKCFALNLGHCNSDYFKSKNGFDIFMPFVFDGSRYTVSLYSTTVDVSVIARKYGGGGHKEASGFVSKELPFGGEQ